MNEYKNKTHIYAAYPFQIYGHILTENNRMETVHRNGNQKKAVIAILISGKIDFQIKIVTRDKEVYYIKIMGSV